MNIIYISPHFPPNFVPFPVQLCRHGANVLGIGDGDFSSFPEHLRGALKEYYWVSSLEDWNQVLAGARYFRDKFGSIARVESLQEYWIPLEAEVRAEVGAAGLRPSQIETIRRKSLMKDKFRQAGIAVARGELLEDFDQARSFLNRAPGGIVAKPDRGVGASRTFRITDHAQLNIFFSQVYDETYFLEECIDGELLSFDGLVDSKGRIVFCAAMAFPLPIMEVVNRNLNLYYYTLRDIPDDLEQAGQRTVKAFQLKNSFFHFEFFREKNSGKLFGLEVNIRPPGLLTLDMWNFTHDMDIYQNWAQLVASNTWQPAEPAKYFVCYASRKYCYSYRHNHEEIVRFCGPHFLHCEQLPPVFRTVGGDVAYLLRSESLEKMLECTQFIQFR